MPVRITKYVIQFEPRLSGWVAFFVAKDTEGHKTQTVERRAVTTPKTTPADAARALARVLKLKGTPPHAEN